MNNLNAFKILTIASVLFVAGCDSGGGSGGSQSSNADNNTPNVNTPNTNKPDTNKPNTTCKTFALDPTPSYKFIDPVIDYNTNRIDEAWLANEIAEQQKVGYSFVFEYNQMLNGGSSVPLEQNQLLFAKMSNAITLNQTQEIFSHPKTLEDAVNFINTKQTDGTLGFYEQTNQDNLTESVNFIRLDVYCSALVSELTRVDTIRGTNNKIDATLSIQALNNKLNELGAKGQFLIGFVDSSSETTDTINYYNPVTQYQFTTTKPKNGAITKYEYQIINQPYLKQAYIAQLNEQGANGYFPVDTISTQSAFVSDGATQTTTNYTIYAKSMLQPNAKFSFKDDSTSYTTPNELYNLFSKYGSENYRPFDFNYKEDKKTWVFVKPEACQDPVFCILQLSAPSY